MTNEVYRLMCKSSPVQKEWKPKVGDKYLWMDKVLLVTGKETDGFIKGLISFWLPRQEDWQEIAEKYTKNYGIPLGLFAFAIRKGDELKIPFSECYTIAWCLFVHKEVWELVWDWDKKVWKRVTACDSCDATGSCMKNQCDEYNKEEKRCKEINKRKSG